MPIDPVDASLPLSSIIETDCDPSIAHERLSCLTATVPLHAEDPDPSAMIDLHVMVVDNGDPAGVGPVLFLQGGPGASAAGFVRAQVGAPHDVISIDQRGVGFSMPKLDCPELDALWTGVGDDTDDDDEASLAAYGACRARWDAEGIDLDAFDTVAAAHDVEIVRRLLEAEPWALWGISYGTRVALTVMREHPEGVRAAVLDSVVPFEVDFFATLPENGLRAITALDAACDASPCADAHGDFLSSLATAARRLDGEPLAVTTTRPASGDPLPVLVTGSDLVTMVFTQLYSTRLLRALPRQVARLDAGGIDELAQVYVDRRDPEILDLAEGAYYSVWCAEEFPFHDPTVDDAVLDAVAVDFGTAFADSLASEGIGDICAVFDVEAADPIDDQPLVSDIPTLVFAGAFDPITPPEWSRQVADALTNSTYVEFADHGHGMQTRCPVVIRVEFLRDPVAVLDTSCAEAVAAPVFE